CLDGNCIPSGCTVDADCDDNNACNGTETCGADFQCALGTAPGTGSACGEPGQVCLGTSCITPQCLTNGDCDDENACTGTETCGANFQCQAGVPLSDGAACGAPGEVCLGTECIVSECL